VASTEQLLAAQSWSVEYMGDAIDDARKVDGVWYRRSIITKDVGARRSTLNAGPAAK
jgi:hypothetical protein